ncbi:TPA: glycosyltransferase [Aeromonas hydrophila]|nr:glycosyltransferase [Aeromonas hydrophila]HAT2496531.1 glycosyltransferase [Aeromonas hydrophila]HAT2511888.1 glycosyltransferase [Aeromonas hydrophila]HAT2532380.1 glycosyltransferase [Aeromonas hydrophila]
MDISNLRVAHYINEIRPGGGPKGYLYNLYEADGDKFFDIVFESKSDSRIGEKSKPRKGWVLKKIIDKILPHRLVANCFLPKVYCNASFKDGTIDQLRKYQVIIFHNLVDFSTWNHKYKKDGQKCYVFSHCPTDLSTEYALTDNKYDWSCRSKLLMKKQLCNMEIEQYKKADGIICPTIHALDGYFNHNIQLREEFLNLHFYEILSGVKKTSKPLNSKAPEKITFLGRYHKSKGFDLFLKASEYSTSKHKWICGGFGSLSDEVCKYDKVKNLGWITNVADTMAEAVVLVIPNRETYFDLVILEAISMGKVIVTTNIGGNKALPNSPGIFLCEPNAESIAAAIDLAVEKYPNGYCHENEALFDELFELDKFRDRHNNLCNELLGRGV